MRRCPPVLAFVLFLLTAAAPAGEEKASPQSRKEALQAFNELIGSWRATGTLEGSKVDKRKNFWIETVAWDWKFKGDDVWLQLTFADGKYYARGELRPLPEAGQFQLRLLTTDRQTLTFTGRLQNRILTLERADEKTGVASRFVVSLLHETRFLYRYETRQPGQSSFVKQWQAGATKEGVAFAGKGDSQPECIVSGGRGTSKITYKGKDYYFCCSGCRDAFQEDPEKYIREYEAKKKEP